MRADRPGATARRRARVIDGLTVLLVQHDTPTRDAARLVLERAGARVLVGVDGRHALEILAVLRPDLVLADLALPGMDGFALIRAVRADARWASLRVVALTASDETADWHRAWEAGFDGHLTTPLALRDLSPFLPAAGAARR
jgi:CheY-like chemotaxis protein